MPNNRYDTAKQNWQEFKDWSEKRLDLAESNYQRAIQYYNNLRQLYIKELYGIQKDVEEEYFDSYLEKINNEFNSQVDQLFTKDKMDKLYKYLLKKVTAIITQNANDPRMKELISIVKNKTIKGSQELTNIMDRTQLALQEILGFDKNIERNIKAYYTRTFGKLKANTSINGLLALTRRSLLDAITEGRMRDIILDSQRMAGYKNLFAGYYSEVLGSQAIDSVNKEINSKWTVKQTGDTPTSNKVFSAYDNVIGSIKNQDLQYILDSLDVIGSNDLISDLKIDVASVPRRGYGVQSKLWVLPKEEDIQKNNFKKYGWYKIGDRSDLLNQIGGGILAKNEFDWYRGWHNNIYLLSIYLTTALGQSQVLYSLRDKFMWTSNLIRDMHEAKLWVSFYYSRKNGKFDYPATKELIWDYPKYQYGKYTEKFQEQIRRKK